MRAQIYCCRQMVIEACKMVGIRKARKSFNRKKAATAISVRFYIVLQKKLKQ